ncbi:hypothetical protein [Mycoplasmopsis glycophila]|uniref:Phage major capsid protein n=1 Tax=Mycoplasmopsis glycophila TaxID=171285 RepID=A0A449AVB5_9BACT|nr:hypothetical protein [Mycoplasmopsis glycophila]VEU70447.1 Uncharacterised protein [Mycoplasmopsis glycophila]
MEIKSALREQFTLAQAGNPTGKALTLNQVQASVALAQFAEVSLFNLLAKNNVLLEANSLSVQVLKNQALEFKPKSTLGTGALGKWRITETETIAWNAPIVAVEGISAYESEMMPVDLAAIKGAKAADQFQKTFERTGFKLIENTIIKQGGTQKIQKDLSQLQPLEIYNELVGQATKLLKTVKPEQGIDLLRRDQIVIMVEPLLFDKLAIAGLLGNRAAQTLEEGQYGIQYVGGYKIVSNPYLTKFDAIVSVNFAAFGAQSIIKMTYGPLDNLSADLGFYFEGKMAHAVLYKDLLVGFTKESNLNAAYKENEYVELPEGAKQLKDGN